MEIILILIFIGFTVWIVSQSKGVKFYQYRKSQSKKEINLNNINETVIYNNLNKSSSKYSTILKQSTVIRDNKKITNPVFHFDDKNELMICYSLEKAKWVNRTSIQKYKPQPYDNIIPYNAILKIIKDKYTDFRIGCYDLSLKSKFGKFRIEIPQEEYINGSSVVQKIEKNCLKNDGLQA